VALDANRAWAETVDFMADVLYDRPATLSRFGMVDQGHPGGAAIRVGTSIPETNALTREVLMNVGS
jgi:hypothetical protein